MGSDAKYSDNRGEDSPEGATPPQGTMDKVKKKAAAKADNCFSWNPLCFRTPWGNPFTLTLLFFAGAAICYAIAATWMKAVAARSTPAMRQGVEYITEFPVNNIRIVACPLYAVNAYPSAGITMNARFINSRGVTLGVFSGLSSIAPTNFSSGRPIETIFGGLGKTSDCKFGDFDPARYLGVGPGSVRSDVKGGTYGVEAWIDTANIPIAIFFVLEGQDIALPMEQQTNAVIFSGNQLSPAVRWVKEAYALASFTMTKYLTPYELSYKNLMQRDEESDDSEGFRTVYDLHIQSTYDLYDDDNILNSRTTPTAAGTAYLYLSANSFSQYMTVREQYYTYDDAQAVADMISYISFFYSVCLPFVGRIPAILGGLLSSDKAARDEAVNECFALKEDTADLPA